MTRVSKQTECMRDSLEEWRKEAAYACLVLSVHLISQQLASVSTWCWFSKATDEIPGSIKGLFGAIHGFPTSCMDATSAQVKGAVLNIKRI